MLLKHLCVVYLFTNSLICLPYLSFDCPPHPSALTLVRTFSKLNSIVATGIYFPFGLFLFLSLSLSFSLSLSLSLSLHLSLSLLTRTPFAADLNDTATHTFTCFTHAHPVHTDQLPEKRKQSPSLIFQTSRSFTFPSLTVQSITLADLLLLVLLSLLFIIWFPSFLDSLSFCNLILFKSFPSLLPLRRACPVEIRPCNHLPLITLCRLLPNGVVFVWQQV